MAAATFTAMDVNSTSFSPLRSNLQRGSRFLTLLGSFTGPSSYATGGFALPTNFLNLLPTVKDFFFAGNSARIWKWNASTSKIQIYTALNTEAANTSDQSAQSANFIAVGQGFG